MTRGGRRSTISLKIAGIALALGHSTPADAQARPNEEAANWLEQQLNNQFMFTTADGRFYRVLQKLDPGADPPRDKQVICIFNDCYVAIAARWDPTPFVAQRDKLTALRNRLLQLSRSYEAQASDLPLPVGVPALPIAREAATSCIADASRC